jgi:NAD(P)-dependent dehydrogenase (short-subunit alcohol dehydrogenase family)
MTKHASGGRVSLAVCDITVEDAVKAWAAFEALCEAGLDLLVSDAGILTPGPSETLRLMPFGANST